MGISGYGCPEMSAPPPVWCHGTARGAEPGAFVGASGLAMRSIAMHGSEEQKQRWLPAMAPLREVGPAFALTEPRHGSDSVTWRRKAQRVGDEW